MPTFDHEQVIIRRGNASGLPIIVALHSTVLGPAIGGCRMWTYGDWRDGLEDALRLSSAMTLKCAVAGLDNGGAKSVVVVPPGRAVSAADRRAVMADLAAIIRSLNGSYWVGEDVGTTAHDMALIREYGGQSLCTPESEGGLGEPAVWTSRGVVVSMRSLWKHTTGTDELKGLRVAVLGLGQVGERLARALRAEGAELSVGDIHPGKKSLCEELGATWVDPQHLLTQDVDILVPAALGGILTEEIVPRLHCQAVVGPANNQLATDAVADLLHARDIVWAPDFLVNAGGVTYAAARELQGDTHEKALARVDQIGDRLTQLLENANSDGVTPYAAAVNLARQRLAV